MVKLSVLLSVILSLLPLVDAAVRTYGTRRRIKGRDERYKHHKINRIEPLICDDRIESWSYSSPGIVVPGLQDDMEFLMLPGFSTKFGGSGDLYFFYAKGFVIKIGGDLLSNYPEFRRHNLDSASGPQEDHYLVHSYPQVIMFQDYCKTV